MKKIVLLAALCLVAGYSAAQKKIVNEVLSEARAEKPNFKEAEAKILGALANDETKNDARTYYVAGELQFRRFDIERNKLYLNQAKDVKNDDMYGSLLSAFEYYEKCWELDNAPNAKGKVRPRYTKDILTKVKDNRQFLINGGVFYYEKANGIRDNEAEAKKLYTKAYSFFSEFAYAPEKPMMETLKLDTKDTTLLQIKYYAAIMASQMQDNQLAIDAYSRMKNDDYETNSVYQGLHYLYTQTNDTTNIVAILEEGAKKLPKESYYIQNLINIYINKGQFDEAVSYLDAAIALEPTNAQLYNVKGGIYEELKNPEAAKEAYQKAIEVDPKNAEAQYNVGRMHYNVAVAQLDEISKIVDQKKYRAEKEKLRPLYEQALPYFEKAYELDAKTSYLAPLRNVYYQLNREADYKRVSALMGE